jgi:hypothetical protein
MGFTFCTYETREGERERIREIQRERERDGFHILHS